MGKGRMSRSGALGVLLLSINGRSMTKLEPTPSTVISGNVQKATILIKMDGDLVIKASSFSWITY
jgi:hypothetical protein